jgi:DNA-binding Lrp family transcriptional regulator
VRRNSSQSEINQNIRPTKGLTASPHAPQPPSMHGMPQPAGQPASSMSALEWQVTRLSLGFVLDTVEISRAGGDLLAPLLVTAILEANLAPVDQDPVLAAAYATLDDAAPDHLRRPVSVNAVAQSLSLPFETVRRRVRKLARDGVCVLTPRGVHVPQSVVTSPLYNAIQLARHQRLACFHAELRTAGALPKPGVAPASAADAEPIRAVNRAISEYMLRISDNLLALAGDPVSGVVLLEMARSNAEGLTAADPWADGWAALAARRPVRASALAVRLRLPAETTRRHVALLEAQGFCVRTSKGLFCKAPATRLAASARIVRDNLVNVQRMFARLEPLGVLAGWEAQATPACGAPYPAAPASS